MSTDSDDDDDSDQDPTYNPSSDLFSEDGYSDEVSIYLLLYH